MIEIESIINSRPFVLAAFDPMDNKSFTPNNLLLLRDTVTLPPDVLDKRNRYARRRWAQIQILSDQFRRSWIREYLPNLQKRQKWFRSERHVTTDDIVLIVNDSLSRRKGA